MLRLSAAFVLTAAVSCSHPRVETAHQAETAGASILAYGASPDLPDNHAAIQAALNANAGGTVLIPAGRWTVGRAGNAYTTLTLPAGTTLIGEGLASVLVLAPGTAPSVHLLELSGAGATVQDLALEGGQQVDTDEHRHGVFVRAAGATLRRIAASGFTGDGLYFYTGADRLTVSDSTATGNGRNGLTLGGAITGGSITGSTFRGNHAQQLDSEPGSPAHVDGLVLRGNTIDVTDGRGNLVSNDYALTICGSAGGASSGWAVDDNQVTGGVYVVWARDVTLHRNTILDPTTKPGVTVYRAASGISVVDNDVTVLIAAAAVAITGTGTGQAPQDILIGGNRITGGGAQGIAVSGALSVAAIGNTITSPAGTGYAAIGARATNPAVPLVSIELRRNHASGWQRGVALSGMAGTTAAISAITATDNALGAAMWLETDGSGALQTATLQGNDPALVAHWPAGAVVTESGGVTTMTRGPQP